MERLPSATQAVGECDAGRQHKRSVSDTQGTEPRHSSASSSDDSGITNSGASLPPTPTSLTDPNKANVTPFLNRKNHALLKMQRQRSMQRLAVDTRKISPPAVQQMDNFSISSGVVNGFINASVDSQPVKPPQFIAIPPYTPKVAQEDWLSVEDDDLPSTTREDKIAWFWRALSENASISYAIFLVSLGIVIYIADIFWGPNSVAAESYNLFLTVTQMLWLLTIHVDTRLFIHKIFRRVREATAQREGKEDKVYMEPVDDGQFQLKFGREDEEPIPLDYGFSSEGSIYIKIGATVFCFGHMIHTGLTFGQQVLYFTEDDPELAACSSIVNIIISSLQPICAFYQLFFIFKYANLIINRRYIWARFGIMHSIGASLCYWVYTILQETLQAIFAKKEYEDLSNDTQHYAAATTWEITYGCGKDTYLSSMINSTAPYLYPFSIEFYILMVGMWMFLKENIGKVELHTHIPSIEVTYEGTNQKSLMSNMVIAVDCHASSRGLFLGLLTTAVTVISVILLFILSASEETSDAALIVNGVTEVMILTLMIGSAAMAFRLVRLLDVIRRFGSSVDDILLYVTLPCIFLYAFLRVAPALLVGDILFVSVSMLQVIQVIIQTALIHDGLRRRSNSSSLRRRKPGREILTFLVVTNVALWLLQTFEIKSSESNSELYKFYGKELWTLLGHLTLPFALFYRFHSSVCLADMWKECYEPDHSH
ncbi:proton channel OtopLc-like [Penaeus monodon]|uniref:proton channel OtopLc-like n=1 Tax=Penaeus monodon TaxID=6687 RepID=UPI0018A7251B|nr:proton channel OtopLc-like [Penaeus monodon]